MFHLRPGSGEPIYQQLARQIKHAITAGTIEPGERLPTVRKLAADLVVNPNTVQRAYRELEQEGLLEGGARRGTFVRDAPPALKTEERKDRLRPFIENLVAEARLLGFDEEEILALIDRHLSSKNR